MASSSGLHSLATIIKRLEAATSRLEDLAALGTNAPSSQQSATPSAPEPGPTPVPPPPPPPPAAAPAIVPAEDPPTVIAYDETIINGQLKPFLELTRSFAGLSVIEQAGLVEKEVLDLREFLRLAASCSKPDQATLEALLTPLSKDIEAVGHAKEAFRKDREWNGHHTVLADGAPFIGWVAVPLKPGPYINDIKESTVFYGNRVIKEFKDKDPKHGQWVRAWYDLLEGMRKYVMEHYTTGLVWNAKGITVEEYKASLSGATPVVAGGPPPPPPPPPPPGPPPPTSVSPSASTDGGVAAVFAELNRGSEVTKGLRKVDKSEMTHKNPDLRAGSTVPASTASASAVQKRPVKPTKPQALAGKKPAKFALEGNKWLIEYQENESFLSVEETERSQTINVYGCKNSTIIVKGKVNAVTLVNCTKTSILVESVISSVSITNSPSFALQITGSAPTVQLDSTDSGQIYLSKECLDTEITTAKCSSINISLPVEGEEEGVFEEHPVPEMFRTTIKDGKLVTVPVEHAG